MRTETQIAVNQLERAFLRGQISAITTLKCKLYLATQDCEYSESINELSDKLAFAYDHPHIITFTSTSKYKYSVGDKQVVNGGTMETYVVTDIITDTPYAVQIEHLPEGLTTSNVIDLDSGDLVTDQTMIDILDAIEYSQSPIKL